MVFGPVEYWQSVKSRKSSSLNKNQVLLYMGFWTFVLSVGRTRSNDTGLVKRREEGGFRVEETLQKVVVYVGRWDGVTSVKGWRESDNV